MSRPRLIAALSAILISVASVASAQDPMGEDLCDATVLAMSKLEMSMAGYGPADEARAGLMELQPEVPAEVWETIERLLDVASVSEGIEVGDPDHPMATGEFQEASRAYREALQPRCPSYDLEY